MLDFISNYIITSSVGIRQTEAPFILNQKRLQKRAMLESRQDGGPRLGGPTFKVLNFL